MYFFTKNKNFKNIFNKKRIFPVYIQIVIFTALKMIYQFYQDVVKHIYLK